MDRDGYIALIVLLGFVMFGCTYMREGAIEIISTPDNIVEELVEEVIEAKTGLDIDLTPGSPEN